MIEEVKRGLTYENNGILFPIDVEEVEDYKMEQHLCFFVSDNKLKFKIKMTDGTIKRAELNLT